MKAGKYDFKVVLKMNYDGKRYELTRQYSVRSGVTVPTKNDDYVQDVFLKVDGHFPPNKEHELAMIMPEEVSRFFLFDGELLIGLSHLGHTKGNIINCFNSSNLVRVCFIPF